MLIDGTAVDSENLLEVGDTEIKLRLPQRLQAGVHGVQVSQPRMLGRPPVQHRGVESNVTAFVLHPVIARRPGQGCGHEIAVGRRAQATPARVPLW